jgi:hypothetical protein
MVLFAGRKALRNAFNLEICMISCNPTLKFHPFNVEKEQETLC